VAARAVRVLTEVAALERTFDYALGDAAGPIGVGDRVRVDLHHRSVRAWVIDDDVTAELAELKTIKKWLGYGPPPTMLALTRWAAARWYGTWSRFLQAASPTRVVTALPAAPAKSALAAASADLGPPGPAGVVLVAPTTDPLGLVLGAYEATREREGSLLVLVPGEGWAERLRARLARRGCAVAGASAWAEARAGWPVVVGTRGAALAPLPRLAGAVILDADDESFRSSAAPTWEAVTLLRERCRRDDAPLWCTSMMPSPVLLDGGGYHRDGDLVGGWPRVRVVDRRAGDPREGVLSQVALEAAHRALAGDEPVAVVVIHQRLGTGRLLACRACGELARCRVCGQAEQEDGGGLACAAAHEPRARFCRACGSTNLKRLRSGVTTLARDVSLQLAQPVSEVTAGSDPAAPTQRVIVGTEAVWPRVRRAGLVVFADFDQYLLAARASARRAAVLAVGRAGRLVGSRREGRASVVLQTRRGEDPVLAALIDGDVAVLVDEDVATARLLGLAPFGAVAEVSGEGAAAFVAGLSGAAVTVAPSPAGFLVRASDVATLTDALRSLERPSARVRVAVE
jgi:primosomal protein N' (replication factor Y)